MEVTKWLKPSDSVSRIGGSASVQAATQVNAVQTSKRLLCGPTWQSYRGRLIRLGDRAKTTPIRRTGVVAAACTQGKRAQHGKPHCVARDGQPDAREGQAGRLGVAERLVIPMKLGNAGGGKGPQFKTNARRMKGTWRLGNLSTPESVQKLQTALHAKAKAEAGYRFYALYDKIYREDILAHAYAQCRSNRGAPGVDGQDFAAVEEYGLKQWLGELALALKEETYRPAPIRRVYIPKANGKLRPLGISTLRDRVFMTAAMLVLEPIFEADLPPEQYAYRPGRNAQQAVVEVQELMFRGRPDIVDADLADYFGSFRMPIC